MPLRLNWGQVLTKTERLFHLLKLLGSCEEIKISEIAVVCRTTRRTVYRDISALRKLGYPVNSEHGYSLENYNTRPLFGQFNSLELRLIRFALETHQLGALFPFADLANRLRNTKFSLND